MKAYIVCPKCYSLIRVGSYTSLRRFKNTLVKCPRCGEEVEPQIRTSIRYVIFVLHKGKVVKKFFMKNAFQYLAKLVEVCFEIVENGLLSELEISVITPKGGFTLRGNDIKAFSGG